MTTNQICDGANVTQFIVILGKSRYPSFEDKSILRGKPVRYEPLTTTKRSQDNLFFGYTAISQQQSFSTRYGMLRFVMVDFATDTWKHTGQC